MAPALTTRQMVHKTRVDLRNIADTYMESELPEKKCCYCKHTIFTNMAVKVTPKKYSCLGCMIQRIERV